MVQENKYMEELGQIVYIISEMLAFYSREIEVDWKYFSTNTFVFLVSILHKS